MKRTALFLYLIAVILSLTACAKNGENSLRTDDDGFDDYDLPEVVVGGICEHCYGRGKCISCHGSGECSCKNGECSNCKGSGKCSRCNGTGKKDCWRCNGAGEMNCSCTRGKCPTCHGSGKILDDFNHSHTCSACNGTGKHKKCKGTGKVECTSCNGKGYQNCDLCSAGSGHCISCSGSGQCKSCDGSLVCRYCGGKGICAYCGGNGHIDGAEDHLLIPLLCGEHRKEWFGDKSNNPQAGSLVFSKYGRAYRLDDSGTVCSACFWTGGYRKSDDGIIIYIVNIDDASIVDPSLNPTPASFEIAGISSTSMEMSVSGSEDILRFTTSPGVVPPDPEESLDNALEGVFSVSADKKVHFSKGNLTYNVSTTTWAFYEHQYDCATGYDSNLISLFTWGYGTWSASPDGTDCQTGDFTDWGSRIGDGNTWRTLSKDEWTYLFSNHSYKWASVNGVNGYVIAQDGFSGELSGTYADNAALAANNLVFLPAAGYRDGSNVHSVGDLGHYWSSTAYTEYSAYSVYFPSSYVSPDFNISRNFGFSVRLITESN